MKRRNLKDLHENSVLEKFESYLITKGKILVINDRPDPPDALVSINKKDSWIEITDAFFNSDFARSITYYVAEDMEHIPSGGGPYVNPDESFEKGVVNVISNKYEKNSIKKIYNLYGPGILLVGLYSPFILPEDINALTILARKIIASGDGRFQEIYLYDQSHNFYPV